MKYRYQVMFVHEEHSDEYGILRGFETKDESTTRMNELRDKGIECLLRDRLEYQELTLLRFL